MIAPVLLLFSGACFAYALSTFCGGGAGLMLLPLLARILPIGEVPVALTLGTTASSIARIRAFRHAVRTDIVRRFVPAAIPGAILGAACLQFVDPHCVELLIGLFLIGNLPALFLRPATHPRPMAPGRIGAIGFLAGFVSGLTGAVGLLFNGCYFRLGLKKEEIVATRAANELLLHLVKLMSYAAFGLLTTRACITGAVIAAAAILATVAIRATIHLVRESWFRRAGYAAMVLSGILMLSSSVSALSRHHRVRLVAEHDRVALHFVWRDRRIVWHLSDRAPGGKRPDVIRP